MPSFCAVVNCNDRYGHSENISFHKFPLKRTELLRQWEAFIQQQRGSEWRASRWSSLCSRHFREDDFRSWNERKTLKKTAVPTILGDGKEKCKNNDAARSKDVGDTEFKEIMAIKERLEDVGNAAKTNCRLCGFTCVAAVTFASNYELYGMLQKCFPTLTIQQDDALPKALCESCNKDLNNFGEFVDRVWMAQTELQRKYKTRISEKPLKIKQEPLVRVKQEVAEYGYDQHQQEVVTSGNDEYEVLADGGHEEGEDAGAVDQKYEFCDFPIMNDCDIMEIINLDDPFINIPDDDNTTTNNDVLELDRPFPAKSSYVPSAHELLQEHLLMEEHNYAYMDTDDFKEERRVYKTEKSDCDERTTETLSTVSESQAKSFNVVSSKAPDENISGCNSTAIFENRALKPIVTSVSAIQQPSKANGIVVLNESIVKSGGGFQLHECMVCQLKFFSIESLKEHYTQTHGTPMVSVPTANIVPEKSTVNTCKTEKEFAEISTENVKIIKSANDALQKTVAITHQPMESNPEGAIKRANGELDFEQLTNNFKVGKDIVNKTKLCKAKTKTKFRSTKRRNQNHITINTMASQYQQLRKLYKRLQRKCLHLEQDVEQLQLHPSPTTTTNRSNQCLNNGSPNGKPKNLNVTNTKHNSQSNLNSHPYSCPVCLKSFSNSNSLRQHKITHSEERRHQCTLCQRSFKRRNGLLQHLKGYHLQVKPFACPVCKHSYALKCDMLRCKHSLLRANRSVEKIPVSGLE